MRETIDPMSNQTPGQDAAAEARAACNNLTQDEKARLQLEDIRLMLMLTEYEKRLHHAIWSADEVIQFTHSTQMKHATTLESKVLQAIRGYGIREEAKQAARKKLLGDIDWQAVDGRIDFYVPLMSDKTPEQEAEDNQDIINPKKIAIQSAVEEYERRRNDFIESTHQSPEYQLPLALLKIKHYEKVTENMRGNIGKAIKFISRFRKMPGIGAEARRLARELKSEVG
jgi:hypothetical protein